MGKLKRTIKEQEFLKAYIDLKGNATKAYLRIHPQVKANSAAELGSKLLKKIDISMAELLNKMGLDDAVLGEKLKDGLNAERQVGSGENKKKVPNYYVVAKYLDMVLRLKRKYPIDESRLKLPGVGDGSISVTLKEIIYSKEGKRDLN